ncbi:MAG: methionine synthase [Jatrophihabitantaceae bacterium]
MSRLWAPGAVTTIGSLPGTDPAEAATLLVGELPDLPHLAELPDRGAGADMIGRTAALLVELPVEIAASGWRLTAHSTRDLRRAQDYFAWDLDALEAATTGYHGPLKLQITGPWTLAAQLELPSGHRVVFDHGATRDLAESLAEGLRAHLADVSRRVPGAQLVVQLDEPSLPAVLGGRLPTASGWGTVRSIDIATVRSHLHDVLDVAPEGGRVIHCCATDTPVALLREAGADAIAFDLAAVGSTQNDALGEAVDAGLSLWAGVLPTTDVTAIDARITRATALEPIRQLWNELGFPAAQLAAAVVPTPSCGLAGASTDYVRRVFAVLREAGSELRELA